MSLKQKTIKIGEKDFTIEQLPTTKGLEVTFAISQIVKGLAEGVTDEFILNFSETKVNIGKMIAGVIANTNVKETPEFIKQIICDSVVSPKLRDEAQLFETHFAGNYEDLSDLLVEIIIFNGFYDLVKKNLLALTGFLQENV